MSVVTSTGQYKVSTLAKSGRRHAGYEFVVLAALLSGYFASVPRIVEFGGISLLGLIGVTVLLAAFAVWLLEFSISRNLLKVLWPLMAFLGYAIVRITLAGWSLGAAQNVAIWSGSLLLIIITASAVARNSQFLVALSRTLRVGLWPIAALLIVSILTGDKDAAVPLAGLVVLAHYFATASPARPSSFFPVGIILALYLFDGARMPVLAGVACLPALQLMRAQRGMAVKRMIRTLLFALAAVALLVVGFLYIDTFRASFLQGDQAVKIAGLAINTSGRMYWWGVVWDSFMLNPWFGNGSPVPHSMVFIDGWAHPHNDYLRLLHQFGIVGLVLWLLYAIRAFIAIIRNAKACTLAGCESQAKAIHDTAALSMLAVTLAMITDNPLVYSFVMYPMAVVIGAALGARAAAPASAR